MLNLGTFGKFGEAVMGLGAAADTYKNSRDNGMSEGASLAFGAAAGVFETLFEHLSLDKLRVFQASPSTSLKSFTKNVLKQSFVEGSEEVLTDLSNEAYDYLINGGLSQYEQALINGMSAEDYTKQFFKQVGETFVTGALAGGGMTTIAGGPSLITGEVKKLTNDMKEGKRISAFGLTDNVLNDAKNSGGILKKKAENAEKRLSDGKNISYRKLGEINRKAVNKQRSSDIDQVLKQDFSSLSKKEKNAIRSSVLTYLSDPDAVSSEQQEVLNTENAKNVLNKMNSIEANRQENWDNARREKLAKQRAEETAMAEEITKKIQNNDVASLVKNTFSAKHKDGYEVNVGAVVSIENGEFEVVEDMETGATAPLSEITIADSEAAVLYKTLQERTCVKKEKIPMTLDAVNIALSQYNPRQNSDAEMYALWAHDAYIAATSGLTFEQFVTSFKGHHRNYISDFQLKQIYKASVSNIETKAGVTRLGSRKLTKMETEVLFLIDTVFKKLGIHCVVTDQLVDEEGDIINGFLSSKDVVVLNLDAGDGLLMVAAGHELFHWLKRNDKAAAEYLQKYVIYSLKLDKNVDFDAIYEQRKKAYAGLKEDDLLEEIAAQYFGVVFSGEKNIRKIVNEATDTEKRYLAKIIGRLKKFIQRMKQALDIYGIEDKTVRAAVYADIKELDEMARMFDVALTTAAKNKKAPVENGGVKSLEEFNDATINKEMVNLVNRVKENKFKPNETVDFGTVSDEVADKIRYLTGFDVADYSVVIEARQIEHILKDHGENGKTDHSLSSTTDIAKMGFVLNDPDEISNAGRTQAYSYMEKGHNRTAKTLLYEKRLDEKSYYVVQAVPITKAKKLFVVTAFIGGQGYKKEASQLINAKSPDATTEYGSAILSNSSVPQETRTVNNDDMQKGEKNTTKYSVKIDAEGNKFVDVDPKLFDVRDGESHAKTIARIIKDRFNNLISVNGQQIQINKTTNREWVRSESATFLLTKKPSLYIDKLKAVSNADEILKTAKNWIGEEPKHSRKDDIVEFARGNIYYRVGQNGYAADVIVGIRANGTAVLYDLKNIYEKEITDTSLAMASRSPQRSEDVSVTDNITQSGSDVKQKNTTKYSVKIDAEGNKFVDVDPKLFDVRDGESHAKTIARIIKDRFNNLISVNGQQIQINKTTNDEWRRAETATKLLNRDKDIYFDKLKTIPYADEILKVAKNWVGEKKHHTRKDDIIEFARGYVNYRVGNNGYVADVLVGIRKNGTAVLYDIDKIKTKKITEAQVTMASEYSQRRQETSVTDNITQSDSDVKKKFSRQLNTDDIDSMSLKDYNNRGWAYGLLNEEDIKLFYEKVSETMRPNSKAKVQELADGTKVFEVNNKILFVNGTFKNPIIEFAVVFNANSATELELINDIYIGRVDYGNYTRNAVRGWLSYMSANFATEYIRFYDRKNFNASTASEKRTVRRASLPDGFASFGYTGESRNRRGSNQDGTGEIPGSKYSRQLLNYVEDSVDQLKAENYSFGEYVDKLIEEVNAKISKKRSAGSSTIFNREEFINIASKYNIFYKKNKNGGYNQLRYSDSEIANTIERVLVGISEGVIDAKKGITLLASMQENILSDGYLIEDDARAKEFRQFVRNKPIYLSPQDFAELIDMFGGTKKSLRAASFHQLSFKEAKDGQFVNISAFYETVKKLFPEFLKDATTSLEMAEELISAEKSLRPMVYYASEQLGFSGELEMHEVAIRRAADILREAFNAQTVQGDLAEQYKELIAVRKSYDTLKQHNKKLLENASKSYYEVERRETTYRRTVRNVKRLSDMLLNETDQRHIPENLKKPIARFLTIIVPFTEKYNGKSEYNNALTVTALLNAYKAYGDNDSMYYDERIEEELEKLQFVLSEGVDLKKLSYESLSLVDDTVKYFSHLVKNANDMFLRGKRKKFADIAKNIIDESVKKFLPEGKIRTFFANAEQGMVIPIYFFKAIGTRRENGTVINETLFEMFNDLRDGQDKWYRNLSKSRQLFSQVKAKNNYSKKWKTDSVSFDLESGAMLTLTYEEMMYMWALYQREKKSLNRSKHILNGGVIADEKGKTPKLLNTLKNEIEVNKARKDLKTSGKEVTVKDLANVLKKEISQKDLESIFSNLTDDMKNYTNAVVKILSTTGADFGNEVSQTLYGYDKFKEKYYIPICVASEYLTAQKPDQKNGKVKVKNG